MPVSEKLQLKVYNTRLSDLITRGLDRLCSTTARFSVQVSRVRNRVRVRDSKSAVSVASTGDFREVYDSPEF